MTENYKNNRKYYSRQREKICTKRTRTIKELYNKNMKNQIIQLNTFPSFYQGIFKLVQDRRWVKLKSSMLPSRLLKLMKKLH